LIPYEAYEVVNHVTLFKVGALLLDLAVVGTWLIASACLSASETGVSHFFFAAKARAVQHISERAR